MKILLPPLLLISLFSSLPAQSCQKVMTGLVRVFEERIPDYLSFRQEIAQSFVTIILPGKSGAELRLREITAASTRLQLQAYESYGIIAGEGDGKIGPRHLLIPTEQATGALGTERTFEVPNSPYDLVHLTIRKTGGKGGLALVACAKSMDDVVHQQSRESIQPGNPTIGTSIECHFSQMATNKFLTLHLVKTGPPTEQISYEVRVWGEFQPAQLRALHRGRQ